MYKLGNSMKITVHFIDGTEKEYSTHFIQFDRGSSEMGFSDDSNPEELVLIHPARKEVISYVTIQD